MAASMKIWLREIRSDHTVEYSNLYGAGVIDCLRVGYNQTYIGKPIDYDQTTTIQYGKLLVKMANDENSNHKK